MTARRPTSLIMEAERSSRKRTGSLSCVIRISSAARGVVSRNSASRSERPKSRLPLWTTLREVAYVLPCLQRLYQIKAVPSCALRVRL